MPRKKKPTETAPAQPTETAPAAASALPKGWHCGWTEGGAFLFQTPTYKTVLRGTRVSMVSQLRKLLPAWRNVASRDAKLPAGFLDAIDREIANLG